MSAAKAATRDGSSLPAGAITALPILTVIVRALMSGDRMPGAYARPSLAYPAMQMTRRGWHFDAA